jgi:hypothetical protein
MTTGWKRPRPATAGPWLRDGKMRPEAAWLKADGGIPAIGGSGRQLLRGLYADKREAAYQKMVDRISNAWKDHRR